MPNAACTGHHQELLDGYDRAKELYPRLAQQLRSHMTLGEALGEDFDPIFG